MSARVGSLRLVGDTDPLAFDRADRMRRALRVSGIGVADMADRLQVSRNAVSSWINGRNQPRRRDLLAFALVTGFPFEWLDSGRTSAGPEPSA